MSDLKDDAQVALAAVAIPTGAQYHHYKDPGGAVYEVVTCAIDEETLEPLVVYRSVTRGTTWVRTIKNWNESVDFNGQEVPRFQKI